MSERVTKTQLQKMVTNLNRSLGRPDAAYVREEDGTLRPQGGHLMLDHIPGAGYALEEMMDSSGVTQPIPRCSARQMWFALRGVSEGLRMAGVIR